jgi:uncharacterized Zn finger protein
MKNNHHLVNIELGICSCPYGKQGAFCKHLWAVTDKIVDLDVGAVFYKPNRSQRESLFLLATGKHFTIPSTSFVATITISA